MGLITKTKVADVVAVAIMGVAMYYFIEFMYGMFADIPLSVYKDVGEIFLYAIGFITGIWAFFRTCKVIDKLHAWRKDRKRNPNSVIDQLSRNGHKVSNSDTTCTGLRP